MKAVRIARHGDLEVLQLTELPTPEPRYDEVRVHIKACGLNHLDVWVRKGVPGHKFPLPITPGCDGSGIIDAVGQGVQHVKVGDEVILIPGEGCGLCAQCQSGQEQLCRAYGILGETQDGTCAEAIVVRGSRVLAKPSNLNFAQAAALPLVYLTAWHMLIARAQLVPGESVLIHAAGSGVSSAAIQIAKLWGATVIVTAGSDEKCQKAKQIGADIAINYQKHDFYEQVRDVTNKRGVEVVIDHVGQATMERSVRLLARGGRLVTCGTTSGSEIALNFQHVFFKSLSILGSTMGSRGELHTIMQHVALGKLRAVVDTIFPLEKVGEAHARLRDRSVFGKIVLQP